jgi:hypothetical protein
VHLAVTALARPVARRSARQPAARSRRTSEHRATTAMTPGSPCRMPRRARGSGTSFSTSTRLAALGSYPAGRGIGEDDTDGCGFQRMTVRCENHHQNREGRIRPASQAAHPATNYQLRG